MDEGKEVLEGFNAGYLIEKHRPELAKQLVSAVDGVDMPFIQGFVEGSKEYSKERNRSKIINKLKETSKEISSSKTLKNKDKGLDIDR
ncbi:MAG: hypothetical protein MRY78_18725 [Saprospiraceae bacterium]|nr:hypothetical protein [Saprospiraceae bacterium]